MKYEVFGKVQGVYFRKHTKETADNLGIVGWVTNTERGTVVGEAVGDDSNIKKLSQWLKNKGSPKSRIDKAEIKIEANLENKNTFKSFDIIK